MNQRDAGPNIKALWVYGKRMLCSAEIFILIFSPRLVSEFEPNPGNVARREQTPPRGSGLFFFFLDEFPDLSGVFP